MKKFKVKFAGIMISIAIIIFDQSLHLHHTEEIKDEILSKIMKIMQYYYGPAIGANLIWEDDIK
jgi:hypothetical protein